uniref:GLPGLI family protein n=1 Tax=Bacteroides thetaiotaomicron TaxID=818 RepID=UPI00359C6B78
MKKIIIISITLFIYLQGYSQVYMKGNNSSHTANFPELEILDVSKLECIYQYTIMDTELQDSKEMYRILQIGEKYVKFLDYGCYRMDSVLNHIDKAKLTLHEFTRIFNTYSPSMDFILKEKRIGKLTVYDRIFTDRYMYEEPVSNFKWSLLKDTMTICGYLCHKATTTFRGRHWVAWYSDLPISEGPWKFCGLPGIILRIEDSNHEHLFTAISIRNIKGNITRKKQSNTKTTRQKFNKALAIYKSNPGSIISGSQLAPKDKDGNEIPIRKKRMFFNPIEKEEE